MAEGSVDIQEPVSTAEQKVTPKTPKPTFAKKPTIQRAGQSLLKNAIDRKSSESHTTAENLSNLASGAARPIETALGVKELKLATYGHSDVLELFRGEKPKDGRKLAIVALGGGNGGGNISAGILQGMHEVGAYQRADAIICVSAGLPAAMYTETDQNATGIKIIQIDNADKDRFIKFNSDSMLGNLRRVWNALGLHPKGPESSLMDTATVAQAMRSEKRKFDVDRFKQSPRKIIAVLTNAKIGRPEYVDAVTGLDENGEIVDTDPINILDAAICVPGISSVPSVKLENGKEYVDGGVSDFNPTDWAFANGYTDVLVLSNEPVIPEAPWHEEQIVPRLTSRAARKGYKYDSPLPEEIRTLWDNIKAEATHVNDLIGENDPSRRIAVMEPTDRKFSGFVETNGPLMQEAYEDAIEQSRYAFSKQTPWNKFLSNFPGSLRPLPAAPLKDTPVKS